MGEPESNKKTILECALRLFSRFGYESTSVMQIVGEAGLAKPTLYYYYGGKNALLEAIVAEYGIPLLRLCERASFYGHDLKANLENLFREMIGYAAEHSLWFRLLVSLYSAAPVSSGYEAGNGIRKRLVASLERLFEKAAEDHGNMKNRQKHYAETFFGLVQTWALLVINQEVILDDEYRRRIVHQYMHGIFS